MFLLSMTDCSVVYDYGVIVQLSKMCYGVTVEKVYYGEYGDNQT